MWDWQDALIVNESGMEVKDAAAHYVPQLLFYLPDQLQHILDILTDLQICIFLQLFEVLQLQSAVKLYFI